MKTKSQIELDAWVFVDKTAPNLVLEQKQIIINDFVGMALYAQQNPDKLLAQRHKEKRSLLVSH